MPRRLVSTCSVIADLPMRVPRLPVRGGDLLAHSDGPTAGGGFNIVAAAARLGARVTLASPVGSGVYGSLCRAALAAEGVEVLDAERDGDTGLCITLVEPDGERTFITLTGVDGVADPALLERADVDDDVVFVSGYDLAYPQAGPVVAAWLARLPDAATLIVDPGPLVADIEPAIWAAALRRCDVLTCNLSEAAHLVGSAPTATAGELPQPMAIERPAPDDAGALAEALATCLRPGATALVRAGAAGCEARGALSAFVPAHRVQALDTTGAGDAHTGALAAALCRGEDLLTAIGQASAAAAFSVTRPGPATGPTTAELAEFLAS